MEVSLQEESWTLEPKASNAKVRWHEKPNIEVKRSKTYNVESIKYKDCVAAKKYSYKEGVEYNEWDLFTHSQTHIHQSSAFVCDVHRYGVGVSWRETAFLHENIEEDILTTWFVFFMLAYWGDWYMQWCRLDLTLSKQPIWWVGTWLISEMSGEAYT